MQEERSQLWPELLGVEQVRARNGGPNHYKALLELAGQTRETTEQIDKDIPRTFAADMRVQPGSERAASLRNVLCAFAAHCPHIGYVQAMNFIAAFLLAHGLSEEDAFWCLYILVSDVVPGYFDVGMQSAKDDQLLFSAMLLEQLPAVGVHVQALAAESIITGFMSSQWLLTLFINVLPTHVTTRLWDVIASMKSRRVLLAACMALIEPHEEELLATTDMGECIELLQSLGPQEEDSESFAERTRRYSADVLTEEWFKACSSWQERDIQSTLASQLQTNGVEHETQCSSLERELEQLEGNSSKLFLDQSNGDDLRQALVYAERATCECGEPVRTAATAHVQTYIVSPMKLLLQSDVLFHQERIRVAQEHFQQSCQRMHAHGTSGLRWDLLSSSLFECWEHGLPEHAIAEAEALLSETSDAFTSLSRCVSQLLRFVSSPDSTDAAATSERSGGSGRTGECCHISHASAVLYSSESKNETLNALRCSANSDTERMQRKIADEAYHAQEELEALKDRKAEIVQRIEKRQALHESAASEWSQKALERQRMDMEKAQVTMETYISMMQEKYSKCQQVASETCDGADGHLSTFVAELKEETSRTQDVLSLLHAAENNVHERQQRLQREEELSSCTREWISSRRRELNACRSSILDQSAKAEQFFAKQLESDWLEKVSKTTEALDDASIKHQRLLQLWLDGAETNVFAARRYACFEYVRLVDASIAIINEVEEQLTPQLPGADADATEMSSETQELSNLNHNSTFSTGQHHSQSQWQRLQRKAGNGGPAYQATKPVHQQTAAAVTEQTQQQAFSPVADARAVLRRLRRSSLSTNTLSSQNSDVASAQENENGCSSRQSTLQQQQWVASGAAAVRSDLRALQRRREKLQSKKKELRSLLDQLDEAQSENS